MPPTFKTALAPLRRRCFVTSANKVRIVEVGPRDGLQNEPSRLSVPLKVELIHRLAACGLRDLEVGSFVNPKAIPQMADTLDVLRSLHSEPLPQSNVRRAVLVPNMKGFEAFMKTYDEAPAEEVSVFAAASEGFSKANTNCTVAESLDRLSTVAEAAIAKGLRVRGYVSVVVECPYDGPTEPKKVADVTKALRDMGCYEVSLGDTIGVATPSKMETMLNAVTSVVPVEYLAAHCHDTYNTGLANVLRMVQLGVRTVDSSIAGLGGCPNAPGAQGNIATEDVVYALASEGYDLEGGLATRLEALAEVGDWISSTLGRSNASRVGEALLASRARAQTVKAKL